MCVFLTILLLVARLPYLYSSYSGEGQLSNEYQHGRIWMALKYFSVFMSFIIVTTALNGLRDMLPFHGAANQ